MKSSLKEEMKKLWVSGDFTQQEIADKLNAMGYETPRGKEFDSQNVAYYGRHIFKFGRKTRADALVKQAATDTPTPVGYDDATTINTAIIQSSFSANTKLALINLVNAAKGE